MSDSMQTRPNPAAARAPALEALIAIALYWLVDTAAQGVYHGPGVRFDSLGLQWLLAHTALVLVGLLIGALASGRVEDFPRLTTWSFRLACLISPLSWAWLGWQGPPETERGYSLFLAAQLLPQIVLMLGMLRGPGRAAMRGLLAAVWYLGAQAASVWFLHYVPVLHLPKLDAASVYETVDVESLYAAQDRLMADQIAKLEPEEAGQPDVFAVLLGGTADQSVFQAEVEAVLPILDAHYGASPRSLQLVNSVRDPERYPLANRANLEAALTAVGARMGPEDMVFLFMTSHGRPDEFSLSFPPAGTADLTAGEFAAILDRAAVGPAVIVISACFSGSFLDDISAPDRLIITAASADRASFGCADGRDWTEFGRSFFDVALRSERDPRRAFEMALPEISAKEAKAELRASLPQISEGTAIGAVLDQVLATRTALSFD
jgi:uncharacterized membrane protein YhdT